MHGRLDHHQSCMPSASCKGTQDEKRTNQDEWKYSLSMKICSSILLVKRGEGCPCPCSVVLSHVVLRLRGAERVNRVRTCLALRFSTRQARNVPDMILQVSSRLVYFQHSQLLAASIA